MKTKKIKEENCEKCGVALEWSATKSTATGHVHYPKCPALTVLLTSNSGRTFSKATVKPSHPVAPTASHTPGPWKAGSFGTIYSGTQEDITSPTLENIHSKEICKLADWRNQQADARLIAAAPELLEALKQLSALVDTTEDAWNGANVYARIAINKAEGRS